MKTPKRIINNRYFKIFVVIQNVKERFKPKTTLLSIDFIRHEKELIVNIKSFSKCLRFDFIKR